MATAMWHSNAAGVFFILSFLFLVQIYTCFWHDFLFFWYGFTRVFDLCVAVSPKFEEPKAHSIVPDVPRPLSVDSPTQRSTLHAPKRESGTHLPGGHHNRRGNKWFCISFPIVCKTRSKHTDTQVFKYNFEHIVFFEG